MNISSYLSQEKHLVAVDCVIFGYENGELKLLLFKRQLEPELGKWSLVGGWLNQDESTEEAAKRVLQKITGLEDIFMDQIHIFSNPDRDSGGRVLSVVFFALIDLNLHDRTLIDQFGAKWWPVMHFPELIFDHKAMVDLALHKLREKASYDIVGRDLLPAEFTIIQLRQLYNSIFAMEFDPGNFRKKMLSLKILEKLDKKDTSESKKGAFYYRFKKKEEIEGSVRLVKYEK